MNTIRAGVFIGINNYDGAPLRGARPDAEKMSKFFKDKYNYVDEFFDEVATEENITNYFDCMKSIFEKENERQRNGVFVFFFSGHGVDRDGHQCLVLADDSEIDLTEIESKTRIPGVKRIFILDCCRVRRRRQDGDWIWELVTAPFGAAGNVIRAVRKFWKNLEEHDPDVYSYGCTPPIWITSCARGQGSIDTPDGGVFTKVLLSVLRQNKVKSIDSFNRAFSNKFDEEVQKPEMKFPAGIEFNLLPAWEKTSGGNTSGVVDKFNRPGDVWQKLVELISSVFSHRHIDAKDTWDTIACWSPNLKDKGGFVDNEMLELALSELQCSIESNFGVKISDSVWRKLNTPSAVMKYLKTGEVSEDEVSNRRRERKSDVQNEPSRKERKKRIRVAYLEEREKREKELERFIAEERLLRKKRQKQVKLNKREGKSFFMEIESVKSTSEYVLVTGRVLGNVLNRGDVIEVVCDDTKMKTMIEGIDSVGRGIVQSAEVGENIECWFKKTLKMHISKGDVMRKSK